VPLVRLRLTGQGDDVVIRYPLHRCALETLGDFGAATLFLDHALDRIAVNPYFLESRETCR
jgi:hypothetical protein